MMKRSTSVAARASFVGMCILLLASFVHESEAFISRASPRLRAAPIMSNDRTRRATMLTMMATPPSKVAVMVNGLPGAMGREVAAACLRRGLTLCTVGLTGPQIEDEQVEVDDGEGGKKTTVRLVKGPISGDGDEECDARLQGLLAGYRDAGVRLIAVDYTHPTAVNPNAKLYARHKLDFVMGTTGGDREKLMSDVKASGIYAVIAPNMAKQIVALQAGLETMAETFPGAYDGYKLKVTESHQSSKADTSGTAKALIKSFGTLLGKSYDVEEVIEMIRDKEGQLAFGVPESGLGGHAFHTYQLLSPDGSVEFQFRHNVVGRRVYAEGTVDALVFLSKQTGEKKVFNMIDVLKAGAM